MLLAADPVAPEVALSTPLLLGIAAAGIAALLVLIIRFKVPAFLALLVVSVLVAVLGTAAAGGRLHRRRHRGGLDDGQGRAAHRPGRRAGPAHRDLRRRAEPRRPPHQRPRAAAHGHRADSGGVPRGGAGCSSRSP
ncbi:MAG: hypothetical protein PGN11_07750 [Quadrisphaera sp.]